MGCSVRRADGLHGCLNPKRLKFPVELMKKPFHNRKFSRIWELEKNARLLIITVLDLDSLSNDGTAGRRRLRGAEQISARPELRDRTCSPPL